MESWANKDNFHRSVTESLISDTGDATIPKVELTTDISEWLGKLSLLYGVPLEYLVPDNRMLPPESIRFFYLDHNWTDRLIDGALSVGVLSTQDQIFIKSFFQQVYQAVDLAQMNTRTIIRNETPQVPTHTSGTITGLFIRSKVVSDYPGLEIVATAENSDKLKLLRMDRLSETLIICLFDGHPVEVEFIQPSEGLHFGIPIFFPPPSTKESYVFLRGLGFEGYEGGKQIDKPDTQEEKLKAEVPFSGTAPGVLDISKLVNNIESKFASLPKNPLGSLKNLTSGGLAIQMVVTKQIQAYKLKSSKGGEPDGCKIHPTNPDQIKAKEDGNK